MSKLRQLLSYLDRPDVTEIVFKTGTPATLTTSSRSIPVTVTPLKRRQILRFFDDTPVIPLLTRAEAEETSHRVTLLQRTYALRISLVGGELEVGVSVPGGQGSTAEIPCAQDDPPPRSSEDSGRHPRSRKHDSSSTRAALGRPSVHFSRKKGPEIDTVRAPSTGRRETLRKQAQPSKATGLTLDRAPAKPSDEGSAPPPPSQRALDARLEHGFGRDDAGPGHPPPSLEVLGAGLERDLLAVPEPGSPTPLSHEDSAPLLTPDLPPIERNEVTFEGDPIDIDAAPLAIETNRFEADTSAPSPADAGPIEAFESTAVDTGPVRAVASARPRKRPTATVPSVRATAFDDTASEPSLADESDWRPAKVSPALLELLGRARRQGATDVHVVAQFPSRIRLAGALEPVGDPLSVEAVQQAVMPLLRPGDAQRLHSLGYADFALDLEGAGRIRVNVCRQRTGLKACFRMLTDGPKTMEDLRLPEEVGKLLNFHQGLVMIAGPNGHGKTATMASIVDAFNSRKPLHILTVEDPVEIIHPRKKAIVTQREVGRHTRTFQTALAAALREDPDVIAIGELRDRETVEMALSAAETGHLVFATMSTPSAAKTIDRLIDMFPPDDQSQVRATLAGALKLVLSQRLVRRRDGRGMVAAFEMITGSVPLWSLIRDNKLFQLPSLLQRGRNFGMIRLDESLKELVQQGLVDREEALAHAQDPRVIDAMGGAARQAR